MPSINKVMLMGNLTRDVELRFTPSGMGCASFGLAINRNYMDKTTNEKKQEVTYLDIEVWGKSAETCKKYLLKGSSVFIEGRLKLDQWNDKQTNEKRSKLKIVGEQVQFMGAPGGKPQAQGATQQQQRPVTAPPAQRQVPAPAPVTEPSTDQPPLPEENYPF